MIRRILVFFHLTWWSILSSWDRSKQFRKIKKTRAVKPPIDEWDIFEPDTKPIIKYKKNKLK